MDEGQLQKCRVYVSYVLHFNFNVYYMNSLGIQNDLSEYEKGGVVFHIQNAYYLGSITILSFEHWMRD